MDKLKLILIIALVISLVFITITQLNSYKQRVYQQGIIEGIEYRNNVIYTDLISKGFTVINIINGNQSQQIVLIPQK